MKRVKYYYNTTTLRYEKLETPLRVKLLRVLGFLSAALVTAFILVSIAYRFFPSANERLLMLQNDALSQQLEALETQADKLQYQLEELEKRDNEVYRTIFEANPVPDSLRVKEMEREREIQLVGNMSKGELETAVTQKINRLTLRMAFQEKSYVEITSFIKNKALLLAATPAIQPVSNIDLKRIASGFGYRIDPVYKTIKYHSGLDFTAPQGTPVYATANGTVHIAGNLGNGFGNHVVINHGYGYETLYGHLFQVKVQPGVRVKRGEIIGWVGNTGKSTGPHCHYEVHKNGQPVDPVYFFYNDLTPEQFDLL
ncbi:MAG: peptidoglycan DD-metalloendopeptidase family protein, partial [Chitinophagaceae bacterium]